MLQAEPPVKVGDSTCWSSVVLERSEVLRKVKQCKNEVCVELVANGLAVLKCDQKYGVVNDSAMILPIDFESIDVVENGWTVAGKYGIYNVYDKRGRQYKGLSFLKKSNAIKFARSLS